MRTREAQPGQYERAEQEQSGRTERRDGRPRKGETPAVALGRVSGARGERGSGNLPGLLDGAEIPPRGVQGGAVPDSEPAHEAISPAPSGDDTPDTADDLTEDGDGYSWETFERSYLRAGASEPQATILKGGASLALNEAAHQGLGNVRAVELCYDRRRRAIGVRPTPGGTKNSYPLRPRSKARGVHVAFQAFSRRYGINTGQATRFRVVFDDGVLVIRQDNRIGTVPGPRAGE